MKVQTDPIERMNAAIARADAFRFMAACFYEPHRETLINSGLLENLKVSLGAVNKDAASYAESMIEAFDLCTVDELLVEYARLFVGPGELRAAPYGSVYLEPGRKVMGETTVRTAEFYREAGLVLDGDFKELPDHIAVELEFMYYLLHNEASCLQQSDGEGAARFSGFQEEFMRDYLGLWARPFCDKIKTGTDNGFYNALAGCLSALAGSI